MRHRAWLYIHICMYTLSPQPVATVVTGRGEVCVGGAGVKQRHAQEREQRQSSRLWPPPVAEAAIGCETVVKISKVLEKNNNNNNNNNLTLYLTYGKLRRR
jgi:hypothetical protein